MPDSAEERNKRHNGWKREKRHLSDWETGLITELRKLIDQLVIPPFGTDYNERFEILKNKITPNRMKSPETAPKMPPSRTGRDVRLAELRTKAAKEHGIQNQKKGEPANKVNDKGKSPKTGNTSNNKNKRTLPKKYKPQPTRNMSTTHTSISQDSNKVKSEKNGLKALKESGSQWVSTAETLMGDLKEFRKERDRQRSPKKKKKYKNLIQSAENKLANLFRKKD